MEHAALGLSHAHTLAARIHGAILPFIIAPAGFLLGRGLGFLHTTHYGFIYFEVVEIHYTFLAVVFPFALILYYLV